MTGTESYVVLRRSVRVLDGMVHKLEVGGRIEVPDTVAMLTLLRSLGDEGCPLLSSQSDGLNLLSGVEDALRKKWAREFVRNWRQLSALLKADLQVEEGVYPQETAQDARMVALHSKLARLERKYTTEQAMPKVWESQPTLAR